MLINYLKLSKTLRFNNKLYMTLIFHLELRGFTALTQLSMDNYMTKKILTCLTQTNSVNQMIYQRLCKVEKVIQEMQNKHVQQTDQATSPNIYLVKDVTQQSPNYEQIAKSPQSVATAVQLVQKLPQQTLDGNETLPISPLQNKKAQTDKNEAAILKILAQKMKGSTILALSSKLQEQSPPENNFTSTLLNYVKFNLEEFLDQEFDQKMDKTLKSIEEKIEVKLNQVQKSNIHNTKLVKQLQVQIETFNNDSDKAKCDDIQFKNQVEQSLNQQQMKLNDLNAKYVEFTRKMIGLFSKLVNYKIKAEILNLKNDFCNKLRDDFQQEFENAQHLLSQQLKQMITDEVQAQTKEQVQQQIEKTKHYQHLFYDIDPNQFKRDQPTEISAPLVINTPYWQPKTFQSPINLLLQLPVLKILLQQILEKRNKLNEKEPKTAPIISSKQKNLPQEIEEYEALEPEEKYSDYEQMKQPTNIQQNSNKQSYSDIDTQSTTQEEYKVSMNVVTAEKSGKKPTNPETIIQNEENKTEKPIKRGDAQLMKQKLLNQLFLEYQSCNCEKKKYNILIFMQWCHRTHFVQLLRELCIGTIDRAIEVAQRINLCFGDVPIVSEAALADTLRIAAHLQHVQLLLDLSITELKDTQLIHLLFNVANEKIIEIHLKDVKQSFVTFREVQSQKLFIGKTISQIDIQKLDPLKFYDGIIVIKEENKANEVQQQKPPLNSMEITAPIELQQLEVMMDKLRFQHLIVQADWLDVGIETPGKLAVTLQAPMILKTLNLRGVRLNNQIDKLKCLRILVVEIQNIKATNLSKLQNLRFISLAGGPPKGDNMFLPFADMMQLKGLQLTNVDGNKFKNAVIDFQIPDLQYLIIQYKYDGKKCLNLQKGQGFDGYLKRCMCLDDTVSSGSLIFEVPGQNKQLQQQQLFFNCPCGCSEEQEEKLCGKIKILNSKAKLNRIELLITTNAQVVITGKNKTLPTLWLTKQTGFRKSNANQLDFITQMLNCPSNIQQSEKLDESVILKKNEEKGSFLSQIRNNKLEKQILSIDLDNDNTMSSIIGNPDEISILPDALNITISQDQSYEIIAKQLTGPEVQIKILSSQVTAQELRLLLCEVFKVPYQLLRIIYRGRVLEDKTVLSDYGVTHNSRLLCYVKAIA